MCAFLSTKKHIFWMILVAVLICIAAAVCHLNVSKNKLTAADFVGTWEFYKEVTDTYESDSAIQAMLGQTKHEIVFREDGTGVVTHVYGSESWENPITYTVSRNELLVRSDEKGSKPVEYAYDPEEGTLHALTGRGEGNRWVDYFVRKGTVTYPAVQLTVDQIAGQWKSDGLPVTKGRSPSLSGTLSLDSAGRASLHLYGDEGTEMTANGTYSVDGSLLRFEPEEVSEPLKYHPWYPKDGLYDLGMTSIYPMNETAATASYDPKSDTIRFYQGDFGVLTFYRDNPVVEWVNSFEEKDSPATMFSVPAFPGVTFCWEGENWANGILAKENDQQRTLYTGLPIMNTFFTDVTGDGKPELCSTTLFGYGRIDERIIVYDYANQLSYILCERGQFDYQLYLENGKLLVKKTSYYTKEHIDTGVLMMRDGVPCFRSLKAGDCTPLYRQLSESEVYGEWRVQEERDQDGNAYILPVDHIKSFDFMPDGTVRCQERRIGSAKAGDMAVYRDYAVYDNMVWILEDAATVVKGTYDRENDTLNLMDYTSDTRVDATLVRAKSSFGEGDYLTQAQADAFVRELPVEFVDGSSYGCDLVCFLDGFGECVDVGDAQAAAHASLRFELLEKQSTRIVYNKLLRVGEREFYLGNVKVFARERKLKYFQDRDRNHPSADAALFVPVDPSMIARNRACVERAGVIRAFDADKREVTVSFAEVYEPGNGYPKEVEYETVRDEQLTLRVTEDTFLSLITDFEYLVRPERFFRYLEENRYYLHSGDDYDDWGIGFWIGSVDDETLLYLCEVYEE